MLWMKVYFFLNMNMLLGINHICMYRLSYMHIWFTNGTYIYTTDSGALVSVSMPGIYQHTTQSILCFGFWCLDCLLKVMKYSFSIVHGPWVQVVKIFLGSFGFAPTIFIVLLIFVYRWNNIYNSFCRYQKCYEYYSYMVIGDWFTSNLTLMMFLLGGKSFNSKLPPCDFQGAMFS